MHVEFKIEGRYRVPEGTSSLARLIHEPAALGRAGFDVSVAA